MKNRLPIFLPLLLALALLPAGCGEPLDNAADPTPTLPFPGPYEGPLPTQPPFTPPAFWPTSAPSPGGLAGLAQMRVLTEADKGLVVRLAVGHPDTTAWFQTSLYDEYVVGKVHWIAVLWHPIGVPADFWRVFPDVGNMPVDLNPNARWYAEVEIGISIQMMKYIVDLDAGQVVYTQFYKESLSSPDRFNPPGTLIPKQ